MTDRNSSSANVIDPDAYFRNARIWYSEIHHMPIAERAHYIVIILLAFLNVFFAIRSFMGVFPLVPPVPFTVYSSDTWEEVPRISRIAENKYEDRNLSVMRFMVRSYIEHRESYDLKMYELRYRNVWHHSSKGVFERYRTWMDASNPYGPYRQHTNKERRDVELQSIQFEAAQQEIRYARVRFATVVRSVANSKELSRAPYQALVKFKYTNFSVDQQLDESVWAARFFGLTGRTLKDSGDTREVVPMTFLVLDYQVRELLE